MFNLKKLLFPLSAVLLLVACGNNQAQPATNTEVDNAENTEQVESSDDQNNAKQTNANQGGEVNLASTEFSTALADALEIFNGEFADAQVESIEFDDDDGQYYYEFEAHDGRDLKIDAQSGDILKKDEDADDDLDDEVIDPSQAITPKEAIDKALVVAGTDAFVESWTLDYEDDHRVMAYEVDFKNAEDVIVDAQSGEILPD